MNRPPPCEFCGRRPLSPGGKRLREHLRSIYSTPMPWHTPEKLKGREEITAALASMPFDGHALVEAAQGHARARGE